MNFLRPKIFHKLRGKGKDNPHPGIEHEAPQERGVALLFL